jgi:hypothetical protein
VERLAVGEQKGDEGPLLFCDVGDNKILCLIGQWLYDPHVTVDETDMDIERAWFRSFVLARAPSTGIVFELRSLIPDLIQPEHLIAANAIPPLIHLLGQSFVIEGVLDTIEESLKRYTHIKRNHRE